MAPKFLQKLQGLVEAVGEVVSSAGELLVDAELRRKGANYIVQEASRGINEAQKGLEAGADALGRSIQQGARARFGAGARQLQSVLRNIERQIQEFQRQQQQQDLQAEFEHHHKLPVDIQIGDQVFEDMPHEMRSRFWYVLLERPDLARQLLKKPLDTHKSEPSSAQQAGPSNSTGDSSCTTPQPSSQLQPGTDPADAAAGSSAGPSSAAAAEGAEGGAVGADRVARLGSPFEPYCSMDPADQGSEAAASGSDATAAAAAAAAAAGSSGGGSHSAGMAAQELSSGGGSSRQPQVHAAGPGSSPRKAGDCSAAASASAGDRACNTCPQAASESNGAPAAAAAAAEAATEAAPAAAAVAAAAAEVPRAPSPLTSGHSVTSLDPPVTASGACAGAGSAVPSSSTPAAPSPWDLAATPPACRPGRQIEAAAVSGAAAAAAGVTSSPPTGPTKPEAAGGAGESAAGSASAGDAAGKVAGGLPAPGPSDGDGWEMVPRDVPSAKAGDRGDAEALETVRTLVESMSLEVSLDEQRAAKQAVFQAMLEVPWAAEEGIPDSPMLGTQYAELLEAGCGSVEEVILRDVPRTFPEHPLFHTQDGQQRLLRVLKAYAAADPEVGYCQGMAFAAGVLLMYVPEEPAFRLFQRLMSPEGPNLRRYYLPGLDHLKLELSCFELLLSSHLPQLHKHLLDAGLPALLYAAQWLMTTYACPFPVHVAARVLDVLLQSDSDAMLPRLGLAVMEALSDRLLELQDFEELITYLKVKPLSWPLHMHRKVFASAVQGNILEAELAAAAAAAREEFARSGRLASFSSRHLSRRDTPGGSERHEVVPGPMGPRSLAATTEAAAAGGGAAAGEAEGSADAAAASTSQQLLGGRAPSSTHDGVLVGPAGGSAGLVDELDALEDLITDLDLLLPGASVDAAAADNALLHDY